jgi:hypothetical protein
VEGIITRAVHRASRLAGIRAAGLLALAALGAAAAQPATAGAWIPLRSTATRAARHAVLGRQTISGLYSPLTPATIASRFGAGPFGGPQLQTLAALLINSVPGEQIDLKQKATSFTTSPGGPTTATLACPQPSNKEPYPYIQQATLQSPNNATLVFCPSYDVINILHVPWNKQPYMAAFIAFKTDHLRNEPDGGNHYKYNLLQQCDLAPFMYNTSLAARYSRSRGINVRFLGIVSGQYCDEMGQFTRTATAQLRTSATGKYHQLGTPLVHVNGLMEILGYAYGADTITNKDVTVRSTLHGTGVRCRAGLRNAQVRVELRTAVVGMHTQKFLTGLNYNTTKPVFLQNHSQRAYTQPVNVCS